VGTITVDENINTTLLLAGGSATLTAGLDILINPPGGTSVAGGNITTNMGNLSLFANNNIIVNGDPVSLSSTTGNIQVIADNDNTGTGNLIINQTISSTTGDICCAAGPGTFGCSQNNCNSGLISGFPFGLCTVHINGGAVTSASGMITVTSAEDIIVDGLSPCVSTTGPIAMTAGLGDLTVRKQVITTGSTLTTFAGNNTNLTQTDVLPLIQASGEIRMITGLNMTLNPNTSIVSTGGQVTVVVDNIHPFMMQPPFSTAVSGRLFMDKNTSIASDPNQPLRLFTAYSEVFGAGPGINFLDTEPALLNGISPALSGLGYPTMPFNNTPFEQWCVFFGCPNNYPSPNLGFPFTFFYKICLEQIVQQANVVVSESLEKFQTPPIFNDTGFEEYWGWPTKFIVFYDLNSEKSLKGYKGMQPEPYFLNFRTFRLVHRALQYRNDPPLNNRTTPELE